MTLVNRESNTLQLAAQAMQLFDFGGMLVKSGMLPQSVRTPEAAVAIMVKGMELGLPAMAALNGITVIQGKPTVSPQLMLSLINRSGQLENIEIDTGRDGATVTMKRRGRTPFTAKFGPTEAQAMGLNTKDNYKKQPAVMYQWRAVAACARVVFPDVIDGLYTPEEMGADVSVDEDGAMTVQVTQEKQAPAAQEPQEDPALKAWGEKCQEMTDRIAAKLHPDHGVPLQALWDKHKWSRSVDAARALYEDLKAYGKAHIPAAPEVRPDTEVLATAEQVKALAAHARTAGCTTSEDRATLYAYLMPAVTGSTKDLTGEQAGFLIDTLSGMAPDERQQAFTEAKASRKGALL